MAFSIESLILVETFYAGVVFNLPSEDVGALVKSLQFSS